MAECGLDERALFTTQGNAFDHLAVSLRIGQALLSWCQGGSVRHHLFPPPGQAEELYQQLRTVLSTGADGGPRVACVEATVPADLRPLLLPAQAAHLREPFCSSRLGHHRAIAAPAAPWPCGSPGQAPSLTAIAAPGGTLGQAPSHTAIAAAAAPLTGDSPGQAAPHGTIAALAAPRISDSPGQEPAVPPFSGRHGPRGPVKSQARMASLWDALGRPPGRPLPPSGPGPGLAEEAPPFAAGTGGRRMPLDPALACCPGAGGHRGHHWTGRQTSHVAAALRPRGHPSPSRGKASGGQVRH